MSNSSDLEAFDYYEPLPAEPQITPMMMVEEYRRTAGQDKSPSRSYKLIMEEYHEFLSAAVGVDEFKELTDLVYVCYGYADSMGWDLEAALMKVHENNMGRMYQEDGTIKRREDGKVIKRPGYPKVSLEDLV